ncbi:MAG: hypothetical protein AAGF97_16330 [Planctomycetota bacterium]
MTLRRVLLALAVSFFGCVAAAQATTFVNENFDSYADTAAMEAVWTPSATGGTLDNALSFSPNNSAAHGGGGTNQRSDFGTVDATATENLVLTARIYDDALVANDRITVGLRGGPFPLFEMGRYNSFDVPSGAGNTDTYGIRATLFSNGISPGWVAFSDGGNAIPATEGWHTYQAIFSLSGLTVNLDLLSDGSIDHTLNFAGDGNLYGGFSDLRFGGPSNLSSAGGGANFDDIVLEMVAVPEPSGLWIAGIAAAAMMLVRRR